MTSFGERLKQLMEDQSISQRDLAAALNISKSTVSAPLKSLRQAKLLHSRATDPADIFH